MLSPTARKQLSLYSPLYCFLVSPASWSALHVYLSLSLLLHPIRTIKVLMRMDELLYDERLEKIGLNDDGSHLVTD